MNRTDFFPRGPGMRLADLAAACGCEIGGGASPDLLLSGVAALDEAGPEDLGFFDNLRHAEALKATRAGCVVVAAKNATLAASGQALLISSRPSDAFAEAGRALFPHALRPASWRAGDAISPRASVDPSAVLEDGVVIDDFAIIAAGAAIGRGTVIGAGAAVGPGCRVGRDCRIGPRVTLQYALVGNGVILHPGVAIGQDGFGYSAGRAGIAKVVQVGRVIIQDSVEIGANTTVDRGSVRDTVIGENTKIDNQVQIAHNVRIGRNCVLVAHVALAGSVTLRDGVSIGGQTVVNNHVTIGEGARIAAVSSVADDVPAGATLGGTPAKPVRDWFREITWVSEMAKAGRGRKNERSSDGA
ncbi:UDP-3-O-(3-hydroxymyristoyl)glucosamine N-acyltransferase [Aureimonas leprariae]|uniref:UDP-3-O-acylglucosamine N-acyltransferase n=1 Tax=Plantimonas leprariae TaxID=2615207 RepID=A0A7V7TXI8_9HYPH|nr:UDP-3-O-(3-hydroxymyristoyl)glucosamine N-acyltransferase [Aureimonas leprariae]KAB0681789.1 UDP-3-O-(3-hydroxymyristoyl)glucosamine N-acyltransferase [Aureimonas leprariae]